MSIRKYEVQTGKLKRKGGGGGEKRVERGGGEGEGLSWNATNTELLYRKESYDFGQEASKETGRGTGRRQEAR